MFDAIFQMMGDDNAIGPRSTISQPRDKLGGRSDIATRVQPEHQADGAAHVDLLKEQRALG